MALDLSRLYVQNGPRLALGKPEKSTVKKTPTPPGPVEPEMEPRMSVVSLSGSVAVYVTPIGSPVETCASPSWPVTVGLGVPSIGGAAEASARLEATIKSFEYCILRSNSTVAY